MCYQAKFNKGGNIKLGSIWSWSKLYGDGIYDYKGEQIQGTCVGHCAGCSGSCYVRKSYRYPFVILSHARNTKAFRDNLLSAFSDLDNQIVRAKNKPLAIRINQSGEIETAEEFCSWVCLASAHPEIDFYVYSKNFDVIVPWIEKLENAGEMPDNFVVLVSVWHEYGISEYNRLKRFSCVKAFVYYDGFDYSKFGLTPDTWCYAYDSNGKMDHNITCQKCRKCFKRWKNSKVIFCNDH